jgi:hypothetical protein
MGERTDAKRSIESSTQHLTDIAQELSRRASPRYLSDQAKEKALNKTHEWTESITTSPLALGLIGSAVGALIGRALANERRTRSFDRTRMPYRTAMADSHGVQYGGYPRNYEERDNGAGIGEKIAAGAHDLRDKATDLRDKAGEMVANVREHIPSAADLSQKADENPMLIALGGLALGAFAALLLPVSHAERELLDPVKQRASEVMGTLGDKLGEGVQQAREAIAGEENKPEKSELTVSGSPILTTGNLITH